MKTTNDPPPTETKPRLLKRQSDPSLLAFVRDAVAAKLQPSTNSDSLFVELAVRAVWRAIRSGTIETAALDVEMGERDSAIQAAWGNIDPVARCHLSIRETQTRQSVHFYAKCEAEAIRTFKQIAALAKSN